MKSEKLYLSELIIENESVKLEWITASEINSTNFEIERSKNGSDWKVVGVVNRKEAAVTNCVYNFIDINITGERRYYRLRHQNQEGDIVFISVAAVSIDKEIEIVPAFVNRGDFIKIINYPNMVLSVSFYNRNQLLWKQLTAEEDLLELSDKSLSPGMYTLEVATAAGIIEKKVFIH